MFKDYFTIFLLFLLTNCTAPGSAFLSPAFTGVATNSLSRTSLSFGTNHIVSNVHKSLKTKENNTDQKTPENRHN